MVTKVYLHIPKLSMYNKGKVIKVVDRIIPVTDNIRYIDYEKDRNIMTIKYFDNSCDIYRDNTPNDETISNLYKSLKSQLKQKKATILEIDNY